MWMSPLFIKGYYSDSSRMFRIGRVDEEKSRLVRVAKECMEKGIAAVKPWTFLGDMSDAVNAHARENGCSIVIDMGSHGVGLEFHEDPFGQLCGLEGDGRCLWCRGWFSPLSPW